jgi:RHS repeat-associated protein
MATYRFTNTTADGVSLKLTERPVYGSSRLGSLRMEVELNQVGTFDPAAAIPVQQIDLNYELTDHLGNVSAVVTGRLLDGNGGGTPKQAELLSAQGYEPFGSLLPGRNYSSGSYSFGFQGQEKDDEFFGPAGSALSFEYRVHDARVGRFLSLDPLMASYPWNSPYTFSENRVIDGVDLEGLEWENFLTNFKNPGELLVKVPNEYTSQKQHYTVKIHKPNLPFSQISEAFLANPGKFLNSSAATFNSPVDGEGKPSQFKVGSYIKIDILGPSNNSYVRIKAIEERKGFISATFETMEGHVEKGVITFSFTEDTDGNVTFDIKSTSEPDWGEWVPDPLSRAGQQDSWFEVMDNVANMLDDKGYTDSRGNQLRTTKLQVQSKEEGGDNFVRSKTSSIKL